MNGDEPAERNEARSACKARLGAAPAHTHHSCEDTHLSSWQQADQIGSEALDKNLTLIQFDLLQ